ncbi:hypothetical protein ACH5RR_013555, partial [Cinchona calisaya]
EVAGVSFLVSLHFDLLLNAVPSSWNFVGSCNYEIGLFVKGRKKGEDKHR